jgi:hypothetical protein
VWREREDEVAQKEELLYMDGILSTKIDQHGRKSYLRRDTEYRL